ncbi:hypothetical protein KKF84_16870 [Myxococcota bacterium]|nr:hypothetical protein [Myxococcota bacterium]MBU1536999.1 hypothetical protein [Myxococcota bacterium]
MRILSSLFFLLISMGCTKTITVFSSKTTFKAGEKILVLKPQVSVADKKGSVERAILNTVITDLGKRGYSYGVAWDKMPMQYQAFFPRVYQAARKVFAQKSNSLEPVVKEESWGEAFIANLNLLGKNYRGAMVARKMDGFAPRFIFISGLEKAGTTFSGKLKLNIYGALIDSTDRSVVWGMSFSFTSALSEHHLVIASIRAAREMIQEMATWLSKQK